MKKVPKNGYSSFQKNFSQKITNNQKNNSQMKKKCLRMDIAVFRKTSAKKLQKITYNQKNNSQ